jgi:rubrerythrin
MKRSFTSLEPPEALQAAILIEERNAAVYRRFAQMFTELGDEESLEIAAVFWEMATEERGHHALLQQKYAEQYPDLICAVTEDELLERIEVPKLNDHEVLAARNDGLLARKLALQVALQAEIGAQSYYANLVKQTPEGPLRQIYGDLAQVEEGHATYLSMKLGQDNAADQSVP